MQTHDLLIITLTYGNLNCRVVKIFSFRICQIFGLSFKIEFHSPIALMQTNVSSMTTLENSITLPSEVTLRIAVVIRPKEHIRFYISGVS